MKIFKLLSSRGVAADAPVLAQHSKVKRVVDGREHNERRFAGGRRKLFEVAEQTDMDIAEPISVIATMWSSVVIGN